MNLSDTNHVSVGPGLKWIIDGDLISTREAVSRKAFEGIVECGHPEWKILEIEMSHVRIIDSKGLNLLVSIIKRAKASGRSVSLLNPQPAVRKTLAFTRIDQHAAVKNRAAV